MYSGLTPGDHKINIIADIKKLIVQPWRKISTYINYSAIMIEVYSR